MERLTSRLTSHTPEPSQRRYFFSANRHSSVYIWGGEKYDSKTDSHVPVDDLNILHQFNSVTNKWAKLRLKGQHPPGVSDGASAIIGESIYFYGGKDVRGRLTGSLYQLNLTTLRWLQLTSPGASGPRRKQGCRMVDYGETMLILYGGKATDGFTNELQIFDIATGSWSSPLLTGDVPYANAWFTFTRVSQQQVVQCGGLFSSSTIYVLDISKMSWTKLPESDRFGISSTATCLGYGTDNAQVVIVGESGVWLLDVATSELMELQDIDMWKALKLKREGHSATVVLPNSDSTSVEILMFGGSTEFDGVNILKDSILVTFKKPPSNKWWEVTDIVGRDELKGRNISIGLARSTVPIPVPTEVSKDGEAVDPSEVSLDAHAVPPEANSSDELSQQVSIPSEGSYTLLPVLKDREMKTAVPGFNIENEISVSYRGVRGSVDWREKGLEITFKENKSMLDTSCLIHIAAGSEGDFKLPSEVNSVSRFFCIHTDKPLNTSATITIYYKEDEDDLLNMCFLRSTDDKPPYNFEVLEGGKFYTEFGEMNVSSFSIIYVGKLLTKFYVWGALSLLEKSYAVSIYYSPKSKFLCTLYVAIVKNCDIFMRNVVDYISREYGDDVKLLSRQLCKFKKNCKIVDIQIVCDTDSPNDVYVEPKNSKLLKTNISRYVDASVPLSRFQLHLKPHCFVKGKVSLEGLEVPDELIFTRSDLYGHFTDKDATPLQIKMLCDSPTYSHKLSRTASRSVKSGARFPFKINNLICLGANSMQQVRLVEHLASRWEEAASHLGLDPHRISNIKRNHMNIGGVEACCCAVFTRWLRSCDESKYDRDWDGVCELLKDMQLAEVAKELKEIISQN